MLYASSSQLHKIYWKIIFSLLFQLTINLMLVSLDEQSIPRLERPYLCCRSTLSVRQLCKVLFLNPILCFSSNCTSSHCKSFSHHYWNWFSCLYIQYVAVQALLEDNEVVLYLVKELHSKIDLSTSTSSPPSKSNVIDPGKDKLRVLGEEETLAGLITNNFIHGYLVIISSRTSLIYFTHVKTDKVCSCLCCAYLLACSWDTRLILLF
jgi:E3 ubiquitin-protein ligase RNF1/2